MRMNCLTPSWPRSLRALEPGRLRAFSTADLVARWIELAGKQVCSAAGGAFLLCLERSLTLELIRAMAELRPERDVCLDAGFDGNNQLKDNAEQIFKRKGVTKMVKV